MKILVFSDSHGNKGNMLSAVEKEQPDTVIYLGDGLADLQKLEEKNPLLPIIRVKGNCDHDSAVEALWCGFLDGVKIYAVHGHEYSVKYDKDLLRLRFAALEQEAKVALFGHTHRAYKDYAEGLWVVNPGTIGGKGASYAVIDTHGGSVDVTIQRVAEE